MKHLPGNPYELHEEFKDAMNAAADYRRYREPEILQTLRDADRPEPEPPTISMEPAPHRCARDDQHAETQQEDES